MFLRVNLFAEYLCSDFSENLLMQIHDIMYKTNMEIDSSCLLAMLKFLDVLMQCSLEGSCGKGLSVRKTTLDTVSECLQILR